MPSTAKNKQEAPKIARTTSKRMWCNAIQTRYVLCRFSHAGCALTPPHFEMINVSPGAAARRLSQKCAHAKQALNRALLLRSAVPPAREQSDDGTSRALACAIDRTWQWFLDAVDRATNENLTNYRKHGPYERIGKGVFGNLASH